MMMVIISKIIFYDIATRQESLIHRTIVICTQREYALWDSNRPILLASFPSKHWHPLLYLHPYLKALSLI